MAATIQSQRNGITPIVGASRDDYVLGDTVTLTCTDPHTTYSWVLAFAPEGSTASIPSPTLQTPGSFAVDVEGPYLIQLTVDAGLGTEDTKEVRLRALTAFGQLTLVAAGERRDDGGVVPLDIDVEGWANEQNANLVTLKDFIKPMVQSGQVLFVDSNTGGASNYADHSTVQDAVDAAVAQTPSSSSQWLVLVRPGTYTEDVDFAPWVHVLGLPNTSSESDGAMVEIIGTHTATIASGEVTILRDMGLTTAASTTSAVLTKSDAGLIRMADVRIESAGVSATQGPAVDVQGGTLEAEGSWFLHTGGGAVDRVGLLQTGTTSVVDVRDCRIDAPIGVSINPAEAINTMTSTFEGTRIVGSEFAMRTDGSDTTVSRCFLDGNSPVLRVHPDAGAITSDMGLDLRFSTLDGSLEFDTTGIVGTTSLNLGSAQYTALTLPGGAVTSQTATTQSASNFYDNTTTGIVAEDVQAALDELHALISAASPVSPLDYHKNLPGLGNNTVYYRGWAPVIMELIAVRVMMETVNTQGSYDLTITNEATGNTMLSAASFDMNTLVAGTPTPVPITATSGDLQFAALDEWTVDLTSDNAAFDGSGIYVSLVFNTATGVLALSTDLATTLVLGNVTGGTNPVLSANDALVMTQGSTTPTTGAAEGAIWNSDGTGSLYPDTPYYRSASNGDIVPLFGGTTQSITQVGGAGSTTLLRGDRFVDVDLTSTATHTLDLPAASTMEGAIISVKRLDTDTTSTLTIDPNGAETIDGVASITLDRNTSTILACTGALWRTLPLGSPPNDNNQAPVAVTASATVNHLWFAPYDCQVVAVKVYMTTAPTTAGTYTLAVEDIDNTNNLLSASTFDMTSLSSATLTTMTLTATLADRLLTTGTTVRFQLVSDNGDLTGDGLYIQIIYRDQ